MAKCPNCGEYYGLLGWERKAWFQSCPNPECNYDPKDEIPERLTKVVVRKVILNAIKPGLGSIVDMVEHIDKVDSITED